MQDLFSVYWQYVAQLMPVAFFEDYHSCHAPLGSFSAALFLKYFFKCLEYLLETATIKFSGVPLTMKSGTLLPSAHHGIIDPAGNLQ